jgi:hypothetical protein
MTTIANGSSGKPKKGALSKETATVPAASTPSTAESTTEIVKLGGGKPDLNHHHAQLDLIKAEIDKTNVEIVSGRLDREHLH